MSGTPTAAAAHIVDWMIEAALGSTSAPDALDGLVQRLRAEGVQIDRAHIAYTTLHPLHNGTGATWTEADGLVVEEYAHGPSLQNSGWDESPMRYVVESKVKRLRRRLKGPGAMLDYPVLKEFAADGLTDYLVLASGFDSFFSPSDTETESGPQVAGMVCSFATARESGFADEEIATIHWLLKPLAVVVKMGDQRQVAQNLASCYIGREAGPRVLGGAIQRGDFASTPAVVWMSDLRASTEMSMTLPREEFLSTLNDFFDCTSGAVEEEGGETLTFIGDSALAIFPIDHLGEHGAREAALKAARRADRALEALSDERIKSGRRPLGWGIALHAGVLEYGNIGSLGRHSWTVIGPVVNETARLESTTKLTGETIVASRAFIDTMDGDWRSLGAFDLQGVPHLLDVYAPPPETPATSPKTAPPTITKTPTTGAAAAATAPEGREEMTE
ncbi:MAG: adenylate/guanylate cyclase domain-containing protein [Pseudomonadota bacterium]